MRCGYLGRKLSREELNKKKKTGMALVIETQSMNRLRGGDGVKRKRRVKQVASWGAPRLEISFYPIPNGNW